jgi:periplasmic divalent cation tolerance protein
MSFWVETVDTGSYNPDAPGIATTGSLQTGGRIYKVLWFVNKKAQYGVNMSRYILCLVTIDDLKKASEIANVLVEKKLAACVNIIPQIQSIYRWKGEICNDTEHVMIIKTREDLFKELEAEVIKLHPYEVPEIISFNIHQGFSEYLRWIDDSTEKPSK